MIVLAASVTFGSANGVYATDTIFVQRLGHFFNEGRATNPGCKVWAGLHPHSSELTLILHQIRF